MIGPCPTPAAPRASRTTVFGIAAAMDLLAGLVLSVVGVRQDIQELAVIGGRLHGVPTPANERVQRSAHALIPSAQFW